MLSKLTICVVLLSLAVAVPASATIITVDDFTSDTRDTHWIQSTVLVDGTTIGTYTFGTTAVDNELTMAMSGFSGTAKQDVLLRDDYSLGVGETLFTDLTNAPAGSNGGAGLFISTETNITSRGNGIWIMYDPYGKVSGYHKHYDDSTAVSARIAVSTVPDSLYIERTATNEYEVGYYVGTTRHTVTPITVDTTGNDLCPGAAIGYFADIRTIGSASFDNFRLDVVPEPSTLVLLGMGVVGLLAYAWRKRK